MRSILPIRCPRKNCLHLLDRQLEVGCDLGFIDTRFPILYDFVDGHTGALQHWTATLNAGLYFDEGAAHATGTS